MVRVAPERFWVDTGAGREVGPMFEWATPTTTTGLGLGTVCVREVGAGAVAACECWSDSKTVDGAGG